MCGDALADKTRTGNVELEGEPPSSPQGLRPQGLKSQVGARDGVDATRRGSRNLQGRKSCRCHVRL